ncbi:MAG: RNA 2'-phosphotransferase [Saprospiraceae bacterium]
MKPISDQACTKLSKFLSLVLRHQPERLKLKLDAYGWTSTEELLQKIQTRQADFTLETLQYVVRTNSKQRFAFNEDGTKIRANQGHSVKLELDLEPILPPQELYHGTTQKYLSSIQATGIQKRNRHHVHLSATKETAKIVGARHGTPVILIVEAGKMHAAGYQFYCTANEVWLTEEVPTRFFRKEEN